MFQVIKVNILEMNEKIEILKRDTEPKNIITIKKHKYTGWIQWQNREDKGKCQRTWWYRYYLKNREEKRLNNNKMNRA